MSPVRDWSLYPDDWADISKRIRFDRAGGKCERCGAVNDTWVIRHKIDTALWLACDGDTYRTPEGYSVGHDELMQYSKKAIHVLLGVAHLDQNPGNNDESNLAALCQRCHLKHDAPFHAVKAVRTKRKKEHQRALDAGQMEMF